MGAAKGFAFCRHLRILKILPQTHSPTPVYNFPFFCYTLPHLPEYWRILRNYFLCAAVAELVDACDSKSHSARSEGSIPSRGT